MILGRGLFSVVRLKGGDMTLLEVSKTGMDRSVHIKVTTGELCIILAALQTIAPRWKPGGTAEKTLRSHAEKVFEKVEEVLSGLGEYKRETASQNRQIYYTN